MTFDESWRRPEEELGATHIVGLPLRSCSAFLIKNYHQYLNMTNAVYFKLQSFWIIMHGTGKEESSPHSALADYRNESQIARQMGSVTWFKPRLTQALRVDCKNWNSSRAILVGCIFNEEIPPEDILVRKWFTQNVWRHSASSCSSSEGSSSSSYLPDHPESKADADMSASCSIVIIVLPVDPLYYLMWVMIGRNLIFLFGNMFIVCFACNILYPKI